MPAVTTTTISGFTCEVRACDSTVSLGSGEVTADPRWHVPRTMEFYNADWVYKRGHSHALYYCPAHAARAYRCGCGKRGGEIYFPYDTCGRHSETADIRTSQATADRLVNIGGRTAPSVVEFEQR